MGVSTTAHAFSLLPFEIGSTPIENWRITKGDTFVVDTKENLGYLVHENGGYTQFLIATGQRRTVRYIGKTYNAATPSHAWVAMTKETKGDHITFGKEGTFFRLFIDGTESTSYGIHTHASIDKMLSEDDRFRSMGCILVSKAMLDVIEATYEMNGQTLSVQTVYGFEHKDASYAELMNRIQVTQKAL